jgi:large subunit ribosomal protein L35
MPKIKTDTGAKKRIKVTARGKLLRRQANRSHLLEKKPSKRTRRLEKTVGVSPKDTREIKRLLGI